MPVCYRPRRGLRFISFLGPGAYAPGFMLTPASLAHHVALARPEVNLATNPPPARILISRLSR